MGFRSKSNPEPAMRLFALFAAAAAAAAAVSAFDTAPKPHILVSAVPCRVQSGGGGATDVSLPVFHLVAFFCVLFLFIV